ncbi:MAG: hypothetical protein COT17_00780 [Elusimicrobia bacterium CG08_land_8_20_14_0_20_51_18]|nr:MAG: hypothetical protein COT17_00780 [Elusimicrobia bacterium CG08_land_8_20_14_0_20_51_18]
MTKILFLALVLCGQAAAAQGVRICGSELEYSKGKVKNASIYYKASEILLNSRDKLLYKYRLAVNLKNESPVLADGLVFRYAVFSKIKKSTGSAEGIWSVPFYSGEVRVSKMGPSSGKKIYILNFDLAEQLRKIRNSGFEIEAVKIEIMKEPKKEDETVDIFSRTINLKKI